MALKAGYVGVKRWLYEKLTKESAANKQSIIDIWANKNKTGAKNLFKLTTTSSSNHNVTWTVDSDGTVTVTTGEDTASADTYIALNPSGVSMAAGSYIFNGCPAGGSSTKYSLFFRSSTTTSAEFGYDTGAGRDMVLDSTKNIVGYILIKNGTKISDNLVFKPMIRYADDPNADFVPYAMTNQQLTAEAATLESVDDAHKTVINGIISAATGAADFAAFKIAMAALTPLTRSAAPAEETRGTVEVDEPVTTTKSTKKTTK